MLAVEFTACPSLTITEVSKGHISINEIIGSKLAILRPPGAQHFSGRFADPLTRRAGGGTIGGKGIIVIQGDGAGS